MRARNIKPGFFKNEALGEIEPLGRILFAGLWCMADREGRLEDRPKRIKAEVLPYESTSAEKLLKALKESGFIIRYSVNGCNYIQIINFRKHQNPHIKEVASSIPAPEENSISTVQEPEEHGSSPADSLIPDSGFSDSLIPDSKEERKPRSRPTEEAPKQTFGEFVKLTESQHLTLIQKFGEGGTRDRIEALDIYIGKIGEREAAKKYKSHYHTILAFDRMDQGRAREQGGPRAAPRPKCYEEVKEPEGKAWAGPIPEAVKRMIGKIG